MICVINFHYSVFINLFILCSPDGGPLWVCQDFAVCVAFWFFFSPTSHRTLTSWEISCAVQGTVNAHVFNTQRIHQRLKTAS